jgi:hypothetical protein
MAKKIDCSDVRKAACAEATRFFKDCHKKAKKDRLIGLVLMPDDEINSLYLMAETNEHHVKQYQKIWDESRDELEAQGHKESDLIFALRYDSVADWKFNDEGDGVNAAISKVWDQHHPDGNRPHRGPVRKAILSALVAGLEDFEKEVGLSEHVDRDDFGLHVFFSDPGEEEARETRAIAKQLNPPKFAARFRKWYQVE